MAAAVARDPTGYDAAFVNDAADGLDASFEFESASGSTRLERRSPSPAADYSGGSDRSSLERSEKDGIASRAQMK
jgi:hypothetical protein